MKEKIVQLAQSMGFDDVKFTSAILNEAAFSHYTHWMTLGRAGAMTYMERDPERRRTAAALLPDAKTVICLTLNYYRPARERAAGPSGQVARYAYGRDYHKTIEKKLKQLVVLLRTEFPGHGWKPTVDTSAVLERGYAEQAGLGYIGKNTTLITPTLGSWVFLSEIVTTLDIGPDTPPTPDTCGHCHLCLDICPTGALVSAYELDANKCISYLTIEHRGSIPVELRPLIGDWLYGCDLCQEICPKNVRAQATQVEEFTVERIGGDHQLLAEILALDTDDAFNERFAGSPMRRAKREGLVRNACIVAANVKATELLPQLEKLARDDASEVVREHAAWAVEHLQ